ncbi:MAG: hypothetical protein OWU32_00450 [Firmicutes bacterium]|nr:hypothetical protein [Bacillota bacterium]
MFGKAVADDEQLLRAVRMAAPPVQGAAGVVARVRETLGDPVGRGSHAPSGRFSGQRPRTKWIFAACAAVLATSVWFGPEHPATERGASPFAKVENPIYKRYLNFVPQLPARTGASVFEGIQLQQLGNAGDGMSFIASYSQFSVTEYPWREAYPPKLLASRQPENIHGAVGYAGTESSGGRAIDHFVVWTTSHVAYTLSSSILSVGDMLGIARSMRTGVGSPPVAIELMPQGAAAVRRVVGNKMVLPTVVPHGFRLQDEYAQVSIVGGHSQIQSMSIVYDAIASAGPQQQVIQIIETPSALVGQREFIARVGARHWMILHGIPVHVLNTGTARYASLWYTWLDTARHLQMSVSLYGKVAQDRAQVARTIESLLANVPAASKAAQEQALASDK